MSHWTRLIGQQRESSRSHIFIVGSQTLLVEWREVITHAERIPLRREFHKTIAVIQTSVVRVKGAVADNRENVPGRISRKRGS